MDRWGCTKITAAGLFRVETALFTLKTLSKKLGDFRFGLLIMDSCYNYLKTASDIFAILRNQKKVYVKMETHRSVWTLTGLLLWLEGTPVVPPDRYIDFKPLVELVWRPQFSAVLSMTNHYFLCFAHKIERLFRTPCYQNLDFVSPRF